MCHGRGLWKELACLWEVHQQLCPFGPRLINCPPQHVVGTVRTWEERLSQPGSCLA